MMPRKPATYAAAFLLVGLLLTTWGSTASAHRMATTKRARPATPVTGLSPGLVASVVGSRAVMVLGSTSCGARRCLDLYTGGVGSKFVRLTAPPSQAPTSALPVGSVNRLVFANRLDGYVVEHVPANATSTTVYATTDGAKTWQKVSFGRDTSVDNLVAAANRFYAVVAHCRRGSTRGAITCRRYQLAHSVAGTTKWAETTIPDTTGQPYQSFGLSASGRAVWVSLQDSARADETVLLRSTNGAGPFSARLEPKLGSVVACSLSAGAGDVLWAECPTGMMVAYWHSPDGGRRFTPIWDFSGTGGALFDPVTGAIAYRYTGIGTTSPRLRPAVVQRTTDSGGAFNTTGRLPLSRAFSPEQLLFVTEQDGYALGMRAAANHSRFELIQTGNGGRTWTRSSF